MLETTSYIDGAVTVIAKLARKDGSSNPGKDRARGNGFQLGREHPRGLALDRIGNSEQSFAGLLHDAGVRDPQPVFARFDRPTVGDSPLALVLVVGRRHRPRAAGAGQRNFARGQFEGVEHDRLDGTPHLQRDVDDAGKRLFGGIEVQRQPVLAGHHVLRQLSRRRVEGEARL